MYDSTTFLVNFSAALAEHVFRAQETDDKGIDAANALLDAVSNMLPTETESFPAPAVDRRLN